VAGYIQRDSRVDTLYPVSVAGSSTDAGRGGSWWMACSAVRMDVAGARGSPGARVHARNAGGRFRRVAPAFLLTGPSRWYAP